MIPREAFEAYERALSANAELAQEALSRLLAALPEGSPPDGLERAYAQAVREFGACAAAVAVEFYGLVRSGSGAAEGYEAQVFFPQDAGLLAWDARTALARAGGFAEAASALRGPLVQRVMERADETILRNAQADPAHPRWALVPHAGACDWCLMLGSRGFAYKSRATALASRHPHCRCAPVADFDARNPRLDGYDPEALYEHYSKNLRAKWGGRRGGKPGSAKGGAPEGAARGMRSIGDVQRHMAAASSVEDLYRRQGEALEALEALFPGKGAYEKALSSARAAASRRYRELTAV